jgi:dihydrodipicolinate synthase/N-acetylneuraminate lyase
MNNDDKTRYGAARTMLIRRLFPAGIPPLWCPALTHYQAEGVVDLARMRAHLNFMRPSVGGFLIPGSTGEGWEMSDAEARTLLELMIDEVRDAGAHLLIGVLKRSTREVIAAIESTLRWLKRRTGCADAVDSLSKSGVCGFTICAPTGAELSQHEIRVALGSVLALDVPIALYQLPQVTLNEIAPETVESLAAEFPHFYLFKDTSGADRVAAAGFRRVFMVRGAEGDYTPHLRDGGGAYDGFLLSTANCFGRELRQMIEQVEAGQTVAAEDFSRRLSTLCEDLFPVAGQLGYGNAFSNANKAIDHFMAHGPNAATAIAPPMLHSGERLPRELLETAGAALERNRLMPQRGYLAGRWSAG